MNTTERVETLLRRAQNLKTDLDDLERVNGGRLPGRYTALARTDLEQVIHWLEDAVEASEGYEHPGT